MGRTNHKIEDVEFIKGSYGHDTITYTADGKDICVNGQFYIDDNCVLHHTHIFDDGEEMEIEVELL